MRCEVNSGQPWQQWTVHERQPIRRHIDAARHRFELVRNGDEAAHEGR